MVLEQQAWAKEAASSSDDRQKPDRDSVHVAYMQETVLHCQSMTRNMLV